MKRIARLTAVCFVGVCLMAPVLPRAMALKAADKPDPGKPLLLWAISLALAGLCIAVAFKSAKRSHQA
jgi:hypothetical protein